jgi:hypothetical protein
MLQAVPSSASVLLLLDDRSLKPLATDQELAQDERQIVMSLVWSGPADKVVAIAYAATPTERDQHGSLVSPTDLSTSGDLQPQQL